MQAADLPEDILTVTRAVQEAQRSIRAVRDHAPRSALAGQLEADIGRLLADLDRLAAQGSVL